MRSIRDAVSLRVISSLPMSLLEGRNSRGCCRVFDRNRKANPHEHPLLRRIQNSRNDAHDIALGGYQRAARASRVHCGVELDQIREQALSLRRAEVALQTGDHARRERRTDAEWKTHRKDLVAHSEIRRRRHVCRHQVVGDFFSLEHRQIVFRTNAGDRSLRFEPVGEHDLYAFSAGYDMEIGKNDALVNDHDSGADAFVNVLASLFVVSEAAYSNTTCTRSAPATTWRLVRMTPLSTITTPVPTLLSMSSPPCSLCPRPRTRTRPVRVQRRLRHGDW